MGLQQSAGCWYTFVTHYTRSTYSHVLYKYIHIRRATGSHKRHFEQLPDYFRFFFVNS